MRGAPGQRFTDRRAAGILLGQLLLERPRAGAVVLGLPRGGVVVAAEVARVLGAPLDVLVAMKLRVPGQPEVAAGGVAPAASVIDTAVVREHDISLRYLQVMTEELTHEVGERMRLLRTGLPPLDLVGRHAILVDDGIASGATLAAAVLAARAAGAARVTAAAPVATPGGRDALAEADDVVVLHVPDRFGMVSDFYDEFDQVSDQEVIRLLRRAALSEMDTSQP